MKQENMEEGADSEGGWGAV